MAYTTIDDPAQYFNTVLYAGNDTAIGSGGQTITGIGFEPNWVWVKRRNVDTAHHAIYDSVRGATKQLSSSQNNAESTQSEGLTAFGSDGFTVGNLGRVNEADGRNYASWNWKAGGSASSDSNGDITSSVSASTTAGFSIVAYTGNGGTATVGHGLGAVPKMIIVKRRSETSNWDIYNSNLGNNKSIFLNATDASFTDNTWNSTTPTSSVFTVGNNNVNGNTVTHIAYCFAEKKGYSKFGSYTGNGNADGTFVYTGFRPAFVMRKRTDSANNWGMNDNKRNTFNITEELLLANSNNAASDGTGIDMLSNGFKMRSNSSLHNASGGTYIYMAFAESPFVNSNKVPTNAR